MPEGTLSLAETLAKAEEEGKVGVEVDEVERKWMEGCRLMTFNEAVIEKNGGNKDDAKVQEYLKKVEGGVSTTSARSIASAIFGAQGVPHWDAELPRTKEGYFHFTGGLPAAIKRVKCFAPYADMLWLETKTPNLGEAQGFAKEIHATHPDKMLAYNLSPSFNWSAHGFSESDLRNFIWDLGRSGFALQLISLAGLHSTGLAFAELSEAYKKEGMAAYVRLVQRREKELGVDILKHQAWSGAGYADGLVTTVSSGSSATAATGKDSTEGQF